MSIYDIFVIIFCGVSAIGHVCNMYKLRSLSRLAEAREPKRRVFLPSPVREELEKDSANVVQIHIPIPKAVSKVINQ